MESAELLIRALLSFSTSRNFYWNSVRLAFQTQIGCYEADRREDKASKGSLSRIHGRFGSISEQQVALQPLLFISLIRPASSAASLNIVYLALEEIPQVNAWTRDEWRKVKIHYLLSTSIAEEQVQ